MHAFDKCSLIEKFNGFIKNLCSTPCEYQLNVNEALENVGSLYTSIQSFVKCTPDFQVLNIDEQRCLFERNLHDIGSIYIHLVYRDTGIFENNITYQTYVMVFGSEMMKPSHQLLKRTYRLFGSQNIYVELMWKYMIYRYGYRDTVIFFSQLIKYVIDVIKFASNIYSDNDTHHDFVDDVVEKTKEQLIINQDEVISSWEKTLQSE